MCRCWHTNGNGDLLYFTPKKIVDLMDLIVLLYSFIKMVMEQKEIEIDIIQIGKTTSESINHMIPNQHLKQKQHRNNIKSHQR